MITDFWSSFASNINVVLPEGTLPSIDTRKSPGRDVRSQTLNQTALSVQPPIPLLSIYPPALSLTGSTPRERCRQAFPPRGIVSEGLVSCLINAVSFGSNGVPSGRKISWNQTLGSAPSGIGISQAYFVLVLPVTSPQLIAAMFSRFRRGMILKKVLFRNRAIYSVQINGRPYFRSVSIHCCCPSG